MEELGAILRKSLFIHDAVLYSLGTTCIHVIIVKYAMSISLSN